MARHFQLDMINLQQRRPRPAVLQTDDGAVVSPSRLILAGGVGIFLLAGFFLLATFHAVFTIDDAAFKMERERASMAVLATAETGATIDSMFIAKLGRDYVLKDARLAMPGSLTSTELSVPLPNSSQVLAWTPRKLATETFIAVAPFRLLSVGLVLICLMVVLQRLYKLARSLETRRQAARDLAERDPLTGLLNRRGFAEALDSAFAQKDGDAALLYIDLDDFKQVNDTHGHSVGDKLLECVAQRLANAAGPDDAVARLGGDEFTILRRGGGSEAQLADFARLIHTRVTGPYGLGSINVEIGLSIGIASRGPQARTSGDLVAQADAALYRAKAVDSLKFAFAEAGEPYSEAA